MKGRVFFRAAAAVVVCLVLIFAGCDGGNDVPSVIPGPGNGGETQQPVTFTVTFNANGGVIAGGATQAVQVQDGQAITLPTIPTKAYHTFRAWYTNSAATTPFNPATAITGNITVWAGWNPIEIEVPPGYHQVSFNTGGGSPIAPVAVQEGQNVARPQNDPTRGGFTFEGWFTAEIGGAEFNFAATQITEPTTIFARWAAIYHAVTFNANGGVFVGEAATYQVQVQEGQSVSAPTEPTRGSYGFTGWFTAATGGTEFNFAATQITAPTNIFALWAVFVPVTGITSVPSAAPGGMPLALAGTVQPDNATNRTIAWSVHNAAGTGAEITDNTLTATAAGTVTVRATIADGTAAGIDFTQDFNIAVTRTHNFVDGICTECHMIKAAAIPEGTLTRGVHTITLSAFNMMVFEVTQDLFESVMGFNPSWFSSNPAAGEEQGRRPVEMVTWFDAVYFANLLSEREGLQPVYTINVTAGGNGNTITAATVTWNEGNPNGWRLPTEAEWEYANRAGSPSGWNWHFQNAADIGNYAWFSDNSGNRTREVGQMLPNAWGLYDTHGNVAEWVWDWSGSPFPNPADLDNPCGPDAGSDRVVRGGGFSNSAGLTQSAVRLGSPPDSRNNFLGFRLVRP